MLAIFELGKGGVYAHGPISEGVAGSDGGGGRLINVGADMLERNDLVSCVWSGRLTRALRSFVND